MYQLGIVDDFRIVEPGSCVVCWCAAVPGRRRRRRRCSSRLLVWSLGIAVMRPVATDKLWQGSDWCHHYDPEQRRRVQPSGLQQQHLASGCDWRHRRQWLSISLLQWHYTTRYYAETLVSCRPIRKVCETKNELKIMRLNEPNACDKISCV